MMAKILASTNFNGGVEWKAVCGEDHDLVPTWRERTPYFILRNYGRSRIRREETVLCPSPRPLQF